jgi:hypothetical protein
MTQIATGVFKKVSIKRQAGQGVIAPAGAAGSAQYMRRTSSTLDLKKATYSSAEILVSQQRRDFRHGVRSVSGSIAGELSVGGYQLPFEGILRRVATVGGTTGAVANLTFASNGAGTFAGTITRAAGSFLTDGFKVGNVVAASGAGVGANTQNLLITGLTALVMTVRTLNATDIVAQGAAANQTVAVRGKQTFVPPSNQTRDYFTVEHFFSDIVASERFVDVVFTGATVTLPATGMATVEFPALGLDMQTGNAEYFTTPAQAPAGAITAAVNGAIIVNGVVIATITGLTITIAGNNAAPGGVVGSNTDPDIFPGVMDISGSISALFASTALRDLFINETEFSIIGVFTGDNTPLADVVSFILPRVKFGDAAKDDVQTGITQTLPFTALENYINGGAGLASEATTLMLQDSRFI